MRCRDAAAFIPIRPSFGRFPALGLEVQLAGDILRTAVAPSFADFGELLAMTAIRTALNDFLRWEIEQERRQVRDAGDG